MRFGAPLEPMFGYTQERIVGHGNYSVQLEVPSWSKLSDGDVRKVLEVVSWKRLNMDTMADGYEGVTGILVKKEEPGYKGGIVLDSLQISGAVYKEINRIGGRRALVEATGKMRPPSTKNRFDHLTLIEEELETTRVVDGALVSTRPEYAPLGSYTESQGKLKIESTVEAGKLPLDRFVVPSIEAYGRYLDLEVEGGHLTFMVYPIPSGGRLTGKLTGPNSLGLSFVQFNRYMRGLGEALGAGLCELHGEGRCHSQLHFSNLFYFPELGKFYVMDWDSMDSLHGLDHLKRGIDVRIPWQNFENVQDFLYEDGIMTPSSDPQQVVILLKKRSMSFLNSILKGYLGREVDVVAEYGEILKETCITDDKYIPGQILRWELSRQ